jgi:hypothetical protein
LIQAFCGLSGSSGLTNKLNEDFARPWAVKFEKEDFFPSAQDRFPTLNDYLNTSSGQYRFHVRRRISFTVFVIATPRHQFFERSQDVVDDVRIGAFIYREGGRGMGYIDKADAVSRASFPQFGENVVGYVDG